MHKSQSLHESTFKSTCRSAINLTEQWGAAAVAARFSAILLATNLFVAKLRPDIRAHARNVPTPSETAAPVCKPPSARQNMSHPSPSACKVASSASKRHGQTLDRHQPSNPSTSQRFLTSVSPRKLRGTLCCLSRSKFSICNAICAGAAHLIWSVQVGLGRLAHQDGLFSLCDFPCR